MYSPDLLRGARFDIMTCHIVVQTNLPSRMISFGGRDFPFRLALGLSESEDV
jgi:hypothetical protein